MFSKDPGPILKHPSGPGIPNEQKKQVFPNMRTCQGASICQLPKSANIPNFRKGANLPIFQKSAYQGFPEHVTLVLERCRHTKVSQRCKRIYVRRCPKRCKPTKHIQAHHRDAIACTKDSRTCLHINVSQRMQTYQSSPKMQTHQGFRGCNCS